MKNIQLLQRYLSKELFFKTFGDGSSIRTTPLGHLVTFAKLDVLLSQDEKDEIVHAINMISEYREKEKTVRERNEYNKT